MSNEHDPKTSDASRTGSKADQEREKLVENADQHREETQDKEKVIPDPANDWPAA